MPKQYSQEEQAHIEFLENIFVEWYPAVEQFTKGGRFDLFAITNSGTASIVANALADDLHKEASHFTRRQVLAAWQAARDKRLGAPSNDKARAYIEEELLHERGLENSFTNDQLTQANDLLSKFRDAAIIDTERADQILHEVQQAIGRLPAYHKSALAM